MPRGREEANLFRTWRGSHTGEPGGKGVYAGAMAAASTRRQGLGSKEIRFVFEALERCLLQRSRGAVPTDIHGSVVRKP